MKNFKLVIMLIGLVLGLILSSGCEFIFPQVKLTEVVDQEIIEPTDESNHLGIIITPKAESTPIPDYMVHQYSEVSLIAGLPGGKGSLDGIGNHASFNWPEGITSDETFIYIADTHNFTIRRISKEIQEVTTIAGSIGILGRSDGIGKNALFHFPKSITNDKLYLYITVDFRIRKIKKATLEVTTLPNVRLSSGGRITKDDKFLYITDTYDNTIKRFNIETSEVEIIAGSSGKWGLKDGMGSEALFYRPEGITNDESYLYVCDFYNDSIRRINKNTFNIDTIAELRYPIGITNDESSLYVTDASNTIKTINKNSQNITNVIGSGKIGNADGIGVSAQFYKPEEITSDENYIYVTDTINYSIRKINKNTLNVTTIAGSAENNGNIDSIGTNARFHFPKGITKDENFIYITDCYNSKIKRIDILTLEVKTIEGAHFNNPKGITNDVSFLYITDTNNHMIKRINKETWEVTTIAGLNYTEDEFSANGICKDGIGFDARFFYPEGISNDEAFIYIADTGNHAIRKINKNTRKVTTIAGSAGNPGEIDRIGTDTKFNKPVGIANDKSFLYISDKYNNRIRRINKITQEVHTIAGSGDIGSSDGIGINAHFKHPEGISCNESFIYVTDTGNHTIRRIEKGTWQVDTIAGLSERFGSIEGLPHDSRFSEPSGITVDGSVLYIADSDNNAIKRLE